MSWYLKMVNCISIACRILFDAWNEVYQMKMVRIFPRFRTCDFRHVFTRQSCLTNYFESYTLCNQFNNINSQLIFFIIILLSAATFGALTVNIRVVTWNCCMKCWMNWIESHFIWFLFCNIEFFSVRTEIEVVNLKRYKNQSIVVVWFNFEKPIIILIWPKSYVHKPPSHHKQLEIISSQIHIHYTNGAIFSYVFRNNFVLTVIVNIKIVWFLQQI